MMLLFKFRRDDYIAFSLLVVIETTILLLPTLNEPFTKTFLIPHLLIYQYFCITV